MFYALDGFLNRVHAKDSIPTAKYKCPVCGGDVIVRGGNKVVIHYAHKHQTCVDTWTYDMSDWCVEMQNMFESDCQEVVVEYNGEKHRADVLKDGIVLLFCDRRIRSQTFEERTRFFTDAGYKVAWIFNYTEHTRNCHIHNGHFTDTNNRLYEYDWSHAPKIFQKSPLISGTNANFAIWFWLDQYVPHLERVVWADKDYDGYRLNKFQTQTTYIDFSKPMDIKAFLETPAFVDSIAIDPNNISKMKATISKKYSGERGHKLADYKCPRKDRQADWIRVFGSNGCLFCKNCAVITEKIDDEKKTYEIDCAFPTVIQETIVTNGQKETNGCRIVKQ